MTESEIGIHVFSLESVIGCNKNPYCVSLAINCVILFVIVWWIHILNHLHGIWVILSFGKLNFTFGIYCGVFFALPGGFHQRREGRVSCTTTVMIGSKLASATLCDVVIALVKLWDLIGCWNNDGDHAPTRPLLASLYKMRSSLVAVCAVLDMIA